MVQHIIKHASSIKIPQYINTIFVRAIRYCREVTCWYRTRGSDSEKDARHDAFVDCLQNALDILRPHIARTKTTRQTNHTTRTSKAKSSNHFGSLKLHYTLDDDLESTVTLIDSKELPSVLEVRIGADESRIEEDFFFQIKAFLNELGHIRDLVLRMWQYKETDLITKSIVSNTAIELVRRREYELERDLVRPAKFPEAKFPTGCLPALLLYRDADLEPLMREENGTMEQIVLPSMKMLYTPMLSEVGQQHAKFCFYPVYNGSKLYCSGHKAKTKEGTILGPRLHEKRDKIPVAFGFSEAVEWAHCLWHANVQFGNFLSEDEVTRGIRHLYEMKEVPVWVTFDMQLHVELKPVLGGSIDEAFKELQRDIHMSQRSAIEISRLSVCTGLVIRPVSAPMTWNESCLLLLSSRVSLKARLMEVSRMRKRYLHGSTFIYGQGWPLTWMISPHSESVSSLGSNSVPSLLYCFEAKARGMSYFGPEGRPSPFSAGSVRM
jgi:hypothetical protein